VVDEKKHPRFERDGNDLIKTVTVDLHEALLGSSVFVSTLNGKSINIEAGGEGSSARVLGGIVGRVHPPQEVDQWRNMERRGLKAHKGHGMGIAFRV